MSHTALHKVTYSSLAFFPASWEAKHSKRKEGRHSTGFRIWLGLNPGCHGPSLGPWVMQLSSLSLTGPNRALRELLLVLNETACGMKNGHILASFGLCLKHLPQPYQPSPEHTILWAEHLWWAPQSTTAKWLSDRGAPPLIGKLASCASVYSSSQNLLKKPRWELYVSWCKVLRMMSAHS